MTSDREDEKGYKTMHQDKSTHKRERTSKISRREMSTTSKKSSIIQNGGYLNDVITTNRAKCILHEVVTSEATAAHRGRGQPQEVPGIEASFH
jgi:hypothetical protein